MPASSSSRDATAHLLSAACPVEVRRPMMRQGWHELTFLHWPYDAAEVQALLPPGLTVETFDGRAWVGLVPFLMEVSAPWGPPLPWVGRFCETNVRTYVRGPTGLPAVWFFSLDANSATVVAAARAGYGLPYCWSSMRCERRDATVAYHCDRRWPRDGARSHVEIEIGRPYEPGEATERDHFLTARWRLYAARRVGLKVVPAAHAPWPLHHADATVVDDTLVSASGLSAPVGPPLVHWSPGVDVRIGRLSGAPPSPMAYPGATSVR